MYHVMSIIIACTTNNAILLLTHEKADRIVYSASCARSSLYDTYLNELNLHKFLRVLVRSLFASHV